MKFKTDENMSREAVQVLRDAGHDVATALSQNLGGKDDAEVVSICATEDRILVTADRRLADSRAIAAPHPGVVVLRLPKRGRLLVANVMRTLLPALSNQDMRDRIWIVEPDRVRVRE